MNQLTDRQTKIPMSSFRWWEKTTSIYESENTKLAFSPTDKDSGHPDSPVSSAGSSPTKYYKTQPEPETEPSKEEKEATQKTEFERLNVENLVIGEFEEYYSDSRSNLYLPLVTTITWHSPDPGERDWSQYYIDLERERRITKILRACPNLYEIKNFRFNTDIDLVLQTQTVHAVHDLSLNDVDSIENILEFSKNDPHVEILHLYNTSAHSEGEDEDEVNVDNIETKIQLSHAITKLLEACAPTLQVLDLQQFCSTCTDLHIPKLYNLQKLILGSNQLLGDPHGKPQASRVLPRHILLDESFPHLKTFDCARLEGGENSNWNIYFPPTHNFYRHLNDVETLVLSDKMSHFWMDKLEMICPNFVNLKVKHTSGHGNNLDFMLVKIFRYWQQLQGLEIQIQDFPVEPHGIFNLDSAFTGLRGDTCRLLKIFGPAGHDSVMKREQVEKSYIRPSIANLLCLKTLDIIFEHHSLGRLAHEEELMPPFTFVSGRYGWGHVEGLKVNIIFDQKCPWGQAIISKFKSLAPYVTLKHRHDSYCTWVHHHQPVEFSNEISN